MLNMAQWLGLAAGLTALLLCAKQHRAGWVVTGVSALGFTAVLLKDACYYDAALQVLLVGISIHGWIKWKPSRNGETIAVGRVTQQSLIIGALVLVSCTAALGYWQSTNPNVMYPYFIGFAIAATPMIQCLLARKRVEAWALTLIATLALIYAYVFNRMYLHSLLYCLYLIPSVYGLVSWGKQLLAADAAHDQGENNEP